MTLNCLSSFQRGLQDVYCGPLGRRWLGRKSGWWILSHLSPVCPNQGSRPPLNSLGASRLQTERGRIWTRLFTWFRFYNGWISLFASIFVASLIHFWIHHLCSTCSITYIYYAPKMFSVAADIFKMKVKKNNSLGFCCLCFFPSAMSKSQR